VLAPLLRYCVLSFQSNSWRVVVVPVIRPVPSVSFLLPFVSLIRRTSYHSRVFSGFLPNRSTSERRGTLSFLSFPLFSEQACGRRVLLVLFPSGGGGFAGSRGPFSLFLSVQLGSVYFIFPAFFSETGLFPSNYVSSAFFFFLISSLRSSPPFWVFFFFTGFSLRGPHMVFFSCSR